MFETRRGTVPKGRIPGELTDRQKDLLDAAVRVLDRSGIDGVTMRTLAQESNLSPMAAYKHYENQRDLYIAIWRFCMDELRGQVMELARSSGEGTRGALRAIMGHFLFFAREYPHRFKLLFDHAVINDVGSAWEIESRRVELRDVVLSMIMAGQQNGQVRRDLSADEMLGVVLSLVQGASNIFVSGRLSDVTTAGPSEMREAILNAVSEYLAPR
jgi:AcrR family transcriptional regulator